MGVVFMQRHVDFLDCRSHRLSLVGKRIGSVARCALADLLFTIRAIAAS